MSSCIGRVLVILKKNQLGLCPEDARKGDVVAVLHGASVPVILRPMDQHDYDLVGPCFVNGIVYGEAVDWRVDEAHRFRIQ
jgi:hypothetical protein